MESVDIINKVNEITNNVNKGLESFYQKISESISKSTSKQEVVDKSKIVKRDIKPSDIVSHIPDLTEIEREKAISVVKDITQEISANKAEYGFVDIGDRGDDRGSKESGDGTGEVKLISVGRPKWFDELDKGIANVFKRYKKREYFDVEGLFRGVTRKKVEKGMKRKNYLYLMLDVSGSMAAYSYKGVPLVALFASYLPPIVKKYEGAFIQVDGREVIHTEFRQLSKQGISEKITLGGGGGASFTEAMEYVKKHIKDNDITDPVVIMASDGHEDFDFEFLPNTIFLTTYRGWENRTWNGWDEQGFPNELKNQKMILIEIDKARY